jgi:hypothetical protein
MATKHGYASKEEFVEGAQKKFPLLENRILDMSSARLLVNASKMVDVICSFLLMRDRAPMMG